MANNNVDEEQIETYTTSVRDYITIIFMSNIKYGPDEMPNYINLFDWPFWFYWQVNCMYLNV